MAFALRRMSAPPLGKMNTTPLIDILLVLLIMFIITLPPQTQSVKVELPTVAPDTVLTPMVNRLSIDDANTLAWNGTAITLDELALILARTRHMDVEPELQFMPDANADYLIVDRILGVIKTHGVTKLGFVGNERFSRSF